MPQPVVVIGLARSGEALVRALAAEGQRVLVVDRADGEALRARAQTLPPGVEVQLGGYADDIAAGAAMVCPSPGVPWDAPELQAARRLGVPVRSEIALVFERCRGRVIGITGTNGKTTTTSLVASILQQGAVPVHLGGNIGVPMLDRLHLVGDDDWVVLELSSFQIETVAAPRCSIACVLNVTPDHLDRHGSFAAYADIKRRVVRFASDTAVLGCDDPVTRDMTADARCPVRLFGHAIDGADGCTVRGGDVVTLESGVATSVLPVADIPLFGEHNVLNVLAAVAISRAAGAPVADIAGSVRAFRAVAHRLQPVGEHSGVLWVDDSKATNPESAIVALRSFAGRPIVWIGGGQGAGSDVSALADTVLAHARLAVLNGASAAELDAALGERGMGQRQVVAGLQDAVQAAAAAAKPGDVVLLAPGYKSFDQFRDYEERGETFSSLVRQLHRESAG